MENILLLIISLFTFLLTSTALVSIFLRVPYVPTKKIVIDKILDEIDLKQGETFIDLGCGDARMLIQAEKKAKINAIGYEIAPLIFLLALFKKFINRSKVKIYFRNFFNENLKKADIIFCYLMPKELKKLAVKIKKECKKGTKIISNTFQIQGLKPCKIIKKNKQTPTLYFYEI
jgi:ribosomal protein L11 methylase PrmA